MTLLASPGLSRFAAICFGLIIASPALGQTTAKPDPPVKPTVTGKFTGNGKNAAIKYVLVKGREPFSDKEAITLFFTEKDPAASKNPSIDAMFGKLGSALILNVFYDGGIFGCEVSHSAHEKRGFSSLGQIKVTDFKMTGGNVSGHVTTGGELDTFGSKWEVDLTFAAPLPDKLRNPTATPPKPTTASPTESVRKEPKPAAGPLVSALKLPLPKDATNVEFKVVVKQIHFACPRPVEAVAKEFSAKLKQQGWKDGAGSLMGKQNAILKREQGDAKLTIMIQPAASGSAVKIFTEGLDWSGIESTPSATGKPAPAPRIEDVEAQAQKALEDALKGLPKGL